jgi:putative transposase
MSVARRGDLVAPDHEHLSIVPQGELFPISRSRFYDVARGESELTLLMRLIDEQVLETPFYGAPRMMRHLRRHGQRVGGHRVWRLMRRMGLAAVYQKSRTSAPHPKHVVYPYLLRDLTIDRPNQV